MDWSRYPNFSRSEFECSATGFCDMDADFMEQLQILREIYGKPMVVTSGYRDPIEHPIEARKTRPGAHAHGVAADFKVSYSDAHDLLTCAIELNVFSGIGIQQSGEPTKRFIHLDMATSEMLDGAPRPTIWSY